MTRAKATAAPAPAPTETVAETAAPEVVTAPAAAPEAPAVAEGIHLRTTQGTDLVNPYTTQKITPAGVEVVRVDGWLKYQIENGKIERYTPEAAAE